MKETPIFRNIQHIPRIWGVTYPKLFATLGGGLFITTLGFFLTSGATAVVKVAMIVAGVDRHAAALRRLLLDRQHEIRWKGIRLPF